MIIPAHPFRKTFGLPKQNPKSKNMDSGYLAGADA